MANIIITTAFNSKEEKNKFLETAQYLYEQYEEYDIEDDLESFKVIFDEKCSEYGGTAKEFIYNWSYEGRAPEDFIGQIIPEDLNDLCVNLMFFGVQGDPKSSNYNGNEVKLALQFLAACGATCEVMDDKVVNMLQRAVSEAMAEDMVAAISGAFTASEVKQRLEEYANSLAKN